MATITTRSGKGSALTFTEMDANFTNLNTDKLELSGGTLTGNLVMAAGKTVTIGNDYTFPVADGTVGQVLQTDGNGNLSFATGAGGGIALTDLSVGAEGTAAGDGSLAYNNTTGVFTYTPPVLSGLSGDTDSISEGTTNLYYTDARFDTRLATKSTTNLSEGTNLYYTDERVDDRVNGLLVAGTNITLTYNDVANTLTIDATDTGITDVVQDTTPQLGGDLDVNGNDIIATGTGSVKIGDGANKYASVDLATDKLIMSNIGLDMTDENITTSTTDGDIKLRPNGTGKIQVGITDTDVAIKTNGSGALTLETSGGNKDITLTPNGTGTSYVQALRVNSATFAHMPQFRRQSTAQTGYALEVSNDSTSTNIAAGQPGGCFGFTHYSDNYSNFGGNAYYPGSINAIIGDEGTLDGSAGENNNAIRLYTYSDQATFGLNNVGEFRYASANFMKETLKFDNTSNVITIEAATANDDLTLKTSGTGDITMNPSGTGYIILNNLPTSSAGLPTGAVWNDSGTLKIA